MKIFFYFFLYFSIFYKQNNHIIKYIFVIFARPSIMHMDCNLKYTTKKNNLQLWLKLLKTKCLTKFLLWQKQTQVSHWVNLLGSG